MPPDLLPAIQIELIGDVARVRRRDMLKHQTPRKQRLDALLRNVLLDPAYALVQITLLEALHVDGQQAALYEPGEQLLLPLPVHLNA